ncbi:hypothetical protein JI721_14745 [Alicyclobacillus cycloheptanicus]|jgi:hypothetical protein|uniref:DUF3592 domain-containing protein n=1 Tax=Alicyclobacillus cycloheptanicus TaxID=1457 RepID=A0ABT9XL50_9BACL|nr:hypothetical protein [Alicyclobacillus cycloheptanicus]MDQ0191034.1 hypothetical protein [Alicyclobacillus cycloheptanicus]WDM00924.1 hypothetical protein JI721_14745 [Alicyclobacillus cycloheptanicus]
MHHPLYPHARRLVGHPVYAYHVSGRVYHGWLHAVTPTGVYMTPIGARTVHATDNDAAISHAVASSEGAPLLVYSPGWFFAFGALAGLTAASVAPYYW